MLLLQCTFVLLIISQRPFYRHDLNLPKVLWLTDINGCISSYFTALLAATVLVVSTTQQTLHSFSRLDSGHYAN